jgi:hypothetical protein
MSTSPLPLHPLLRPPRQLLQHLSPHPRILQPPILLQHPLLRVHQRLNTPNMQVNFAHVGGFSLGTDTAHHLTLHLFEVGVFDFFYVEVVTLLAAVFQFAEGIVLSEESFEILRTRPRKAFPRRSRRRVVGLQRRDSHTGRRRHDLSLSPPLPINILVDYAHTIRTAQNFEHFFRVAQLLFIL